ncbi:MAG TPA: TetR/AcrR family transcriptional regulator C-terminal domain-containing protein [Pseudonocardiaceae bacterium]|jgi:AcrR family transcriptional regulator|nr:TetR/AcrR family transcriptional regulator C-terminal domain-containing protein [Pseudonocardiaceae bacterium]
MAKRTEAAVRERLSRETIVTSALALADREGLEAVTIRRLALDHGVTPMALYWHFKEKEQLLDGIAERLFAMVALPTVTDGAWDQQLRDVLDALLAAIRPHPAVAALAPPRVLSSEAGLTLAERVLGLLRTAGFSAEQAAQVGSYLLWAIITLVTAEPGHDRTADPEAHEAHLRNKKATLSALEPQRYPNVIDSVESLVTCADEDSYFSTGLDLLVEGTLGILPAQPPRSGPVPA